MTGKKKYDNTVLNTFSSYAPCLGAVVGSTVTNSTNISSSTTAHKTHSINCIRVFAAICSYFSQV